jgi:hypothetical protein
MQTIPTHSQIQRLLANTKAAHQGRSQTLTGQYLCLHSQIIRSEVLVIVSVFVPR